MVPLHSGPDPLILTTDSDPAADPNPALFVSDFQDSNKNLSFFSECFFKDKVTKKSQSDVRIQLQIRTNIDGSGSWSSRNIYRSGSTSLHYITCVRSLNSVCIFLILCLLIDESGSLQKITDLDTGGLKTLKIGFFMSFVLNLQKKISIDFMYQ